MKIPFPWRPVAIVLLIFAGVLWLRWATFGGTLWNVDEAIHAAAARTILDGGVLYRDACDIRNPLSYYAVAGVFALCGENNLWAVRCLVALLIVATAGCLWLVGQRLRGPFAGLAAAALYVALSSAVLFPGDAYAANTEWFVAFFSSAAALVFLSGGPVPSTRRLLGTGALLAGAFLSKQPALLEAAAPFGVLLYLGRQRQAPARAVVAQLLTLIAGWFAPVVLTTAYFWAKGALAEAVFYTWIYNVTYYGPEIPTADRFAALLGPFKLLVVSQVVLVGAWLAGVLAALHRLAQRQPTPEEAATNPGLLYVVLWTLLAWAGAASSGRNFDHYTIQFLAPFCLGGGLVLAVLADWLRSARHPLQRIAAGILLAGALYQAGSAAWDSRGRTLPDDSSLPVAAYIREHSTPADRIFVWGFHADIYLYADRKPASRYLFGGFQTGMIPWTNVGPGVDTTYASVPGTMDLLVRDLAARLPLFIVDCSAGPNRHWQKYPLENYPPLHDFVRQHYRQVEPSRFLHLGYRLYRRLSPGEAPDETEAMPPLAPELTAKLALNVLARPLAPLLASAPHGADRLMADGRVKYFAHAPSVLVYRVPAGATALRGGFGIEPGAYAADNKGPTDGAEFIVRWRPAGGPEQILLRRLLRPRDEPADRPIQSFRVALPASAAGGELELAIGPGPADNAASDWTFWIDLALENSPVAGIK